MMTNQQQIDESVEQYREFAEEHDDINIDVDKGNSLIFIDTISELEDKCEEFVKRQGDIMRESADTQEGYDTTYYITLMNK